MSSCQVTLSDRGGGSVCFPPLFLLCFLDSLVLCLQDSLLVFGNAAEARLSLEASLAAECCCCCWGTGFFLAFFLSWFSVELLVVLQGHKNKETWSESQKRIEKRTGMLPEWGPTPVLQKRDSMRYSCFPAVVSSWEQPYCPPWPKGK